MAVNSPILITGAGGFIGYHLANKLAAEGEKVSLLLRKTSLLRAHAEELKRKVPSVSLHFADILDAKKISSLLNFLQPRKVFHFAGVSSSSRNQETFLPCLQANLLGTLYLLQSLTDRKLELFVFASTPDVYGQISFPFKEEQKIEPVTPYGISKAAAEYLCRFFYKEYRVPTVIVRISPVYGPLLKPDRLIMKVFDRCMHAKKKEIQLTSPHNSWDFLYIDDLVDALRQVALNRKVIGETINLGGGKAATIQEVVETICSITATPLRIQWQSKNCDSKNQRKRRSDIRKAKKILGWKPKTGLREGLLRTYQWLLQKQS